MARSRPEKIEKAARRRSSKAGVVSTTYTRGGFGARWRLATDFAPSLDAVALVDHVSDVVLAEHWHAIGEGRKASSDEKQPPLAQWGLAARNAAEGKRPAIRGFTGHMSQKPFRDNLERSPIKVSGKSITRSRVKRQRFGESGFVVNETVEGTKAKTTIRPDKVHETFMGLELQRGNLFLYVGGKVAEAVDAALAAWLTVAIDGALKKGNRRELKAVKARTRGGGTYGA